MKKAGRIAAIAIIIITIALVGVTILEERLNITIYPGSGDGTALLVLLPTVAGKGSLYRQQGLIDLWRKHGAAVDIMTINVLPTLYLNKRIVTTLKRHVIEPAKADGYRHIYLLGTSLGGHAVLLYAMAHPDDIDGMFLFAPYISDPFVTHRITSAGGLDSWNVCPPYAWHYSCDLWESIRAYLADPERRTSVFLGYGTDDRFVESCRILADALPPANVFTTPGGHSWHTWRTLWEALLTRLATVMPARFTDRQ